MNDSETNVTVAEILLRELQEYIPILLANNFPSDRPFTFEMNRDFFEYTSDAWKFHFKYTKNETILTVTMYDDRGASHKPEFTSPFQLGLLERVHTAVHSYRRETA